MKKLLLIFFSICSMIAHSQEFVLGNNSFQADYSAPLSSNCSGVKFEFKSDNSEITKLENTPSSGDLIQVSQEKGTSLGFEYNLKKDNALFSLDLDERAVLDFSIENRSEVDLSFYIQLLDKNGKAVNHFESANGLNDGGPFFMHEIRVTVPKRSAVTDSLVYTNGLNVRYVDGSGSKTAPPVFTEIRSILFIVQNEESDPVDFQRLGFSNAQFFIKSLELKGGERVDTLIDQDNDGVSDYEEAKRNNFMACHILDETNDSDGDGVSNIIESNNGKNPLDSLDFPIIDSDNDGLPDSEEKSAPFYNTDDEFNSENDSDGDGASNMYEKIRGTDPLKDIENPSVLGLVVTDTSLVDDFTSNSNEVNGCNVLSLNRIAFNEIVLNNISNGAMNFTIQNLSVESQNNFNIPAIDYALTRQQGNALLDLSDTASFKIYVENKGDVPLEILVGLFDVNNKVGLLSNLADGISDNSKFEWENKFVIPQKSSNAVSFDFKDLVTSNNNTTATKIDMAQIRGLTLRIRSAPPFQGITNQDFSINYIELTGRSNGLNNSLDFDEDGVSNSVEKSLNNDFCDIYNPNNDTDGDGYSNLQEKRDGTSAEDSNDFFLDIDRDGVRARDEPGEDNNPDNDSDNDGFSNIIETTEGTNPLSALESPDPDVGLLIDNNNYFNDFTSSILKSSNCDLLEMRPYTLSPEIYRYDGIINSGASFYIDKIEGDAELSAVGFRLFANNKLLKYNLTGGFKIKLKIRNDGEQDLFFFVGTGDGDVFGSRRKVGEGSEENSVTVGAKQTVEKVLDFSQILALGSSELLDLSKISYIYLTPVNPNFIYDPTLDKFIRAELNDIRFSVQSIELFDAEPDASFEDTDEDGVIDGVEISRGGSYCDIFNPNNDTDGDGFTNIQETVANSDPENSNSIPINLGGDISNVIIRSNSPLCVTERLLLEPTSVEGAFYRWEKPSGEVLDNRVLSVVPVSFADTGLYKLRVNTLADTIYDSVVVVVNPAPVRAFLDAQTISDCENKSVALRGVGDGFVGYKWYLEGGLLKTSTDSTFVPNLTGIYSMVAIDSNGCNSATSPLFLDLEPDSPPEITYNTVDSKLTSTPGVNYQWYLNNLLIAPANKQELDVYVNGDYKVEVRTEAGCVYFSEEVTVDSDQFFSLSRSIEEELNSSTGARIAVHENGSGNKIQVKFSSFQDKEDLVCSLYDLEGNLLESAKFTEINSTTAFHSFDSVALAAGIYVVHVRGNKVFKSHKVLVK